MTDNIVIISVLGFNLKAEILDENDNPIATGTKSIMPETIFELRHRYIDRKWFTNYNQSLLDKIVDYKRLND